MTVRYALLDGLARNADIFEVLSGPAPLHPRNDTFLARCSLASLRTR